MRPKQQRHKASDLHNNSAPQLINPSPSQHDARNILILTDSPTTHSSFQIEHHSGIASATQQITNHVHRRKASLYYHCQRDSNDWSGFLPSVTSERYSHLFS